MYHVPYTAPNVSGFIRVQAPAATAPVATGTTAPEALAPGALSPGALSPGALSPGALSPGALSPGALSPAAATPAVPPPGPPEKCPDLAPAPGQIPSLQYLFCIAHPVVQGTMILLLLLALFVVAVTIEKIIRVSSFNGQSARFLKRFRQTRTLAEAQAVAQQMPNAAMAHMMGRGVEEMQRSVADGLAATAELRDRILKRVQIDMNVVQEEEIAKLGSSMSALATIGATSPFIGLFATVFGIMNSFLGIAATKQTNLAVVAPGIAEALLATAIGLVAAIPAVIAYNFFAKMIGRSSAQLDNFAGEFAARVSHELDMGGAVNGLSPARPAYGTH